MGCAAVCRIVNGVDGSCARLLLFFLFSAVGPSTAFVDGGYAASVPRARAWLGGAPTALGEYGSRCVVRGAGTLSGRVKLYATVTWLKLANSANLETTWTGNSHMLNTMVVSK